jgi:hypothetical protein
MVIAMNRIDRSPDIAEGARQLARAAAEFEQSASGRRTSAALPEALEDLKETLELLARGVAKASEAIDDPAQQPGAGLESDLQSVRARALRWHLAHLAARLLGARVVCPQTRRWAHELLEERDVDPAPDGVIHANNRREVAMEVGAGGTDGST